MLRPLSLGLGDGGSNAIQITLTIDSDLAATVACVKREKGIEREREVSPVLSNAIPWVRVRRNHLIANNIPVLLVSLDDINLLQSLEDLASDGTRRVDVVRGAGTAVDRTTVELLQGTNTNAAAEVDVAGNGCCMNHEYKIELVLCRFDRKEGEWG